MENYKEISRCLCCESNRLQTIFDLGNQSPVNNYNVTEKYPLKLKVCLQCTHAQLSHSVSPLILFNMDLLPLWGLGGYQTQIN